MTKLKCPICKQIKHIDKRWEIEQFISQTQDEITYQTIADKFSISPSMARKYLLKLTDLKILDMFKRNRIYIFTFCK